MESNDGHSNRTSSYHSRKRRLSRESEFSLDRYENRTETVDQDLESSRNDSSQQLLHELKSKNRELEAHIDRMFAEFKTMKSENQDLKSQYDRLASQNRELESRINKIEQRSHPTKTTNQAIPRQNDNFEQHSGEIQSTGSDIEKLVKDFDERCDLVESNNQELTERLDSCQQNYFKISRKNEGFENQLMSLQQHLNNVVIHDKDIQHNRTIANQQLVEDDAHQSTLKTDKIDLTDDMNISKEQCHNNNDNCILIEKTLCTPCENQIPLSTDEIQYGIFDVCDKYNVILMKEKDKLKLFDHEKQIDERPWGELDRNNYATCIHWCSFLDKFLILYRFRLDILSLKLNEKTSQMKFDDLINIKSIRVYSLKRDTTNRCNNAVELLRFITTSPNLPDYLFLNRGYRRIELINTNSWKMVRGWSKQDLEYGERDEIRLITCSYDGSYLAMNIKWNDRVAFVDLRKHDGQMTLIKRIRTPDDSLSLHHRIQMPFDHEKWLVVDERNQCYTVSTNPHDQNIILVRTDQVQAIENVPLRARFFRNNQYLLVGMVIRNGRQNQGMLKFYKVPVS